MPVKQENEDSSQAKYLQIAESLKSNFASGVYRHGTRLPSEAELTRKFKVSRMTVVKAMQQLQQEGLITRRVGAGTFAVANDRTDSLVFGLLIPDLGQTEIFEPICRGMAKSPQAGRHSLLWGHSVSGSDNQVEQARELCAHYLTQRVNGVFFAPLEFSPVRDEVNQQILNSFDKARIPVILLDRGALPFPARSQHDLVGLDNRRAAYVLTEHLISTGAQNIAFVSKSNSAETVAARILGCREALHVHGKSLADTVVMRDNTLDEKVLKKKIESLSIDAFMCANDEIAAHLMKMLLSMGYKIPKQVRIVGFDDVRYAGVLPVPLTTMHQPCADIGSAAMSAIIERIRNPNMKTRSILLDASLIVRQSCGSR